MLLKNRVAIISGGATGIGRGIAVRFAAEGCKVVIADIAEAEGQKTAEAATKKGSEAIFIKCDVTSNCSVQEMAVAAEKRFGKIDILVNSAGGVIGEGGSLETVDEDNWDKNIALNLKSQYLCCRAVVPGMKRNKYGKIINISSMGAIHPPVSFVHYHAAKGGVIGLTNNLAFELAQMNITVNAILPGPIRTEFYNETIKNMPDKEAFFTALGKHTPMQRIGTPEDVAGVALFLATELSAYVTAQSICVGGGLPLTPQHTGNAD